MRLPNATVLLSVLALAAMLSTCGCDGNAKAIARQQEYVLDVTRPAALPPATESKGILKMRRFTTASQFETYELVYRRSELVYESDFYNRYFAPPASLVAESTRRWLADGGTFTHVLDAFSAADYDYLLEGNVLALYGDYRQKGSPKAVVEIGFTLIDERRARDSVVFHEKYIAIADIQQQNAANLVMGFNTCLADILTQLERDLAALALDQK